MVALRSAVAVAPAAADAWIFTEGLSTSDRIGRVGGAVIVTCTSHALLGAIPAAGHTFDVTANKAASAPSKLKLTGPLPTAPALASEKLLVAEVRTPMNPKSHAPGENDSTTGASQVRVMLDPEP
jgi:hypothetical protein